MQESNEHDLFQERIDNAEERSARIILACTVRMAKAGFASERDYGTGGIVFFKDASNPEDLCVYGEPWFDEVAERIASDIEANMWTGTFEAYVNSDTPRGSFSFELPWSASEELLCEAYCSILLSILRS